MPIPDDERFEAYLKQFRPMAPKSLPSVRERSGVRRWFVFARWAVAIVALLVLAILVMHPRPEPAPSAHRTQASTRIEEVKNLRPLTLGNADELLAQSPSFKAAIDRLAFQPQTIPLSKGRQSALAVLSKENQKL